MKTSSSKVVGYWHYGVILTYLSVISAIAGMFLSFAVSPMWGVVCLFVSGICDSFDGIVARSRKNRTDDENAFGCQIDSLSDIIAFGIAPVMIGWGMGMHRWYYIVVFGLFVMCALIRLAHFNVKADKAAKAVTVSAELAECAAADTAPKKRAYEGLPVTNVAVGLPVFFLVATMFHNVLITHIIMAVAYFGFSLLFVLRFRVPKLGWRGIVITITVEVAIVIALALVRTFVCGVPLA